MKQPEEKPIDLAKLAILYNLINKAVDELQDILPDSESHVGSDLFLMNFHLQAIRRKYIDRIKS